MNYLSAAGIRVRLKQMERAAFYVDWQTKKLRGVFMTGAGNSGNAASRVEAFIRSKGAYAYGSYPDIDELFAKQAVERDHAKREALLFKDPAALDRPGHVRAGPGFSGADGDRAAGHQAHDR
jgi:peptide/nickel transport system substrate-binding protein